MVRSSLDLFMSLQELRKVNGVAGERRRNCGGEREESSSRLLLRPFISGPVHMEASQPAYRAGALCRDLTSSLIPIQNLISVHMNRRAGPLSEIPLV